MSELAISLKLLFICKETKVRALRFTEQLSDLTLHRKAALEASGKKNHHESGEAHTSKHFTVLKEQYV